MKCFEFFGIESWRRQNRCINILFSLPRIAGNHKFLALVPSGCGYEKINLNENCEILTIPPRKFNDVWRLYFDNFVIPKICKNFGANVPLLCTITLKVPCRHVLMLRRPQLAYRIKN